MNYAGIPDASAAGRGLMTAAHYTKLDALMSAAAQDARFAAIESDVVTLEAASHAAVTLGGGSSSWLELVGQALTLTLVAATTGVAGIVSAGAQIIDGAKTFLNAVVMSAGLSVTGSISSTTTITAANVAVTGTASGTVPIFAKGAPGQSVPFAQLNNSSSVAIFTIDQVGDLNLPYGRVRVANGSASAPAYSFSGDTATGFWWQQTGGMVCVANGVRQWRTNGGANLYLADDARWIDQSLGAFSDAYGGLVGLGGSAQPANCKGVPTNGATAIGAKIGSNTALTTEGAAVVGFYNTTTLVGGVDKDGAMQLNIAGGTRPAAAAAHRGKIWYSKGAGGVADTIEVCLKDAADAYAWVQIKP